MYVVYFYDSIGVKVVALSFGTLKDAFLYARTFARNQRMSHDQLFIEYCHGGGCQLIGDIGQVALEYFSG